MAPKAAAAEPKAKADPKAKAKGKAKAAKVEDEEPKMDAPDRAALDAAVAKIQEEIEGFQKEQQALAGKISGKSGGKDQYYAERAEIRAQLDEFSAKIDVLMEQKGGAHKAMTDKKAEGQDMKNELSKMKKSIGYNSEADIDQRIAHIEHEMGHSTISLKQEKDYMKEMAELRKCRPKVAQVNSLQENLANRDTGSGLRENLGDINAQMALYRDGKRKVQEKLAAVNEARKAQMGDVPEMIEQREGISKKIQEKIAERNTIRDEFRAKEREFNNFKNEQRRVKQEKYQEQQGAQRAEWEHASRARKAEALDNQPYVSEITLIEQTMAFLKGLVADKGPVQKEEKKETVHSNKADEEVLMPDRDEEMYFVPTKTKKKGKSNKNSGAKEGGAKPIKHNAVTFRLFDQLKLNAPTTTDDIPALLEKLEEQLKDYQEKVKEWEHNRDERKAKILAGEDVEEKPAPEEKAAAEGGEAKEE